MHGCSLCPTSLVLGKSEKVMKTALAESPKHSVTKQICIAFASEVCNLQSLSDHFVYTMSNKVREKFGILGLNCVRSWL